MIKPTKDKDQIRSPTEIADDIRKVKIELSEIEHRLFLLQCTLSKLLEELQKGN